MRAAGSRPFRRPSRTMDTILVANAGSSSVKFQVFEITGKGELDRLIKGQIDGIGVRPRLRGEGAARKSLIDRSFEAGEIADIPAAMQAAANWLRDGQNLEPSAVGHRVVHGGPNYDRPMLIDDAVLGELERYVPLAPLHQPNNLAPIRAIRGRFPNLPQVACFDTAFHRGHDPVVDHFAIPERFYNEGVRRYGFHGLSYEFIAQRLQAIAPDIARKRVIGPYRRHRQREFHRLGLRQSVPGVRQRPAFTSSTAFAVSSSMVWRI